MVINKTISKKKQLNDLGYVNDQHLKYMFKAMARHRCY